MHKLFPSLPPYRPLRRDAVNIIIRPGPPPDSPGYLGIRVLGWENFCAVMILTASGLEAAVRPDFESQWAGCSYFSCFSWSLVRSLARVLAAVRKNVHCLAEFLEADHARSFPVAIIPIYFS
jgi:hypothetical protein